MKKHSTENNRLPLRQILIGLFVTMLTALAGAGLVAYLTQKYSGINKNDHGDNESDCQFCGVPDCGAS